MAVRLIRAGVFGGYSCRVEARLGRDLVGDGIPVPALARALDWQGRVSGHDRRPNFTFVQVLLVAIVQVDVLGGSVGA